MSISSIWNYLKGLISQKPEQSCALPGAFSGTYLLEPISLGGEEWNYIPNKDNPLTFIRCTGQKIVIDFPFITDFATVPDIFAALPGLERTDMCPACIIHDGLYQSHHNGKDILGFLDSNLCLEEMCITQGYNRVEAYIIGEVCNTAGVMVWNKKPKS